MVFGAVYYLNRLRGFAIHEANAQIGSGTWTRTRILSSKG